MLMENYGHRIYFYLHLTLCCLEVISLPFDAVAGTLSSHSNDDVASSITNGENVPYHPTYEDQSLENLPFPLQKSDRKYLNFDSIDDHPMLYGSTDVGLNQEKKASRNFLRFGRRLPKNFIRFGHVGPIDFGLGGNDLEEIGIDKKGNDRNFLRFGRGNMKNFIRFGRASDRNFIRFGRSINDELNRCKDCAKSDQLLPSPTDKKNSVKFNKNTNEKRNKRSIPAFYDDLLFMAPTPLSWIENLGSFGPSSSNPSNTNGQGSRTANGQKRGHSRSSFLRYGRDPLDLHFLRFGKRGLASSLVSESDKEDGFPREARTSKNFLRFG